MEHKKVGISVNTSSKMARLPITAQNVSIKACGNNAPYEWFNGNIHTTAVKVQAGHTHTASIPIPAAAAITAQQMIHFQHRIAFLP